MINGKGDVACQFRQKINPRSVEEFRLARIQRKCANRFMRNSQRQDDDRA